MERLAIAHTAVAVILKMRIFRKAHFVRTVRYKRMIQRSHVVAMRLVTGNNTNIPIGSVRKKLDGNDTGFCLIVRQQSIKIHMSPLLLARCL